MDGRRGDELVLARAVVGQVEGPREAVLEIVRREDRVVADLAQARGPVCPDVGVRPHEHARVAHEAAQPTDRGRAAPRSARGGTSLVGSQDARLGQVRQEPLPHPDRTRARAAAAVGRAERLVDVEVHDVEAGLAGLEPPQDGVEVGAVHVGQRAGLVHRIEQLPDARLEQAQGRWVRDHDRRGPRAERCPERGDVDPTVRRGRDRDGPEAGHRRGRGIGAVARIRHEDLVAVRVAAGVVVGADHEDAGQLALGARRRLERHGLHARDLGQRGLEFPEELERALRDLVRAERVERREPRAGGRPTR